MRSIIPRPSRLAIGLLAGLLLSPVADAATLTGPPPWGNPDQSWGRGGP